MTMTTTELTKRNDLVVTQADFILLDRSASMESMWREALGGVNAYVEGLKEQGVATEITFATFDRDGSNRQVTKVHRQDHTPAVWRDVNNDDAEPRGSTPLYDAVADIVELAERKGAQRCAIIIMTDGEENSSQRRTRSEAKALLDKCRERGWQVIMLGANFDNWGQAQGLGNLAGATASVSAENFKSALADTATMRSSYGAAGKSMGYSEEQKRRWK